VFWGNRSALKHGEFSAETIAIKKEIAALARMARETVGAHALWMSGNEPGEQA
jgi:hypothetical protein